MTWKQLGILSLVWVAACTPPSAPKEKPGSPSGNATKPGSNATAPRPVTTPHHTTTNRLAKEKSPYLQQHKLNPVDWFPWGEEAFALAKKENKPIFLSIGYSTCHWCHVMERESFEDHEVAEVLNAHFVSIKVDREERPDVDKIYMTFVQATTGGGGWPMSVFLTPERNPFHGGTYFRKPDFIRLLQKVDEVWKQKHAEISTEAGNIAEELARVSKQELKPDAQLAPGLLTNAVAKIKASYDPRHGGFGRRAPKFPQPSEPSFLLAQAVRHKDEDGIKMVLHTCDRMAAGGMYDQLGGGFARYSVDEEWLVPHFEKMLYDNAQLLHLYLDAHLVSGDEKYATVAREIAAYLRRDMTHPEGGWYSAEDADSEGHEGKFYCWTKAQVQQVLSPDEARVAIRYFGITETGNFEDHSHPSPLKQLNVLHISDPKLSADEAKLLATAKQKLLAARVKRVRPHLDDKVLSSWNGLMLGAMARAHAVLGDEDMLKAAEKNVAFIQARLWDEKTKTLYHRWRDGERDSVQLLEAYAYQLDGVLHLYQTTLKPSHLEFALDLAQTMIRKFYDESHGGFWQDAGAADLILRVKENHDGATPAGGSVAALALLRLAAITDQKAFAEKAEKTLRLSAPLLDRAPQALPYMLSALDYWLNTPWRAVVAGDPANADVSKLIRGAHGVYQPNKVVLGTAGPVEEFARGLKPGAEGPVVYACSGTECQLPTADIAVLQGHLKALRKAPAPKPTGPAKGGPPSP